MKIPLIKKESVIGAICGVVLFSLLIGYGVWQGEKIPPKRMASATGSILLEDKTAPQQQNSIRASLNKPRINWNDVTTIVNGQRLPFINEGKRVFDLLRLPSGISQSLSGEPAKPQLAILMTGLGFDNQLSEQAIKSLPTLVGIALRPDAPYLANMTSKTLEKGYELWLNIGSDSIFPDRDNGTNILRTNTPATKNIALLNDAMSAMSNYVGVVLSPDSIVASSRDDMDPILKEIGARGLGFARLSPKSDLAIEQIALKYRVPFAANATSISYPPFAQSVEKKLNAAVQQARESGTGMIVIEEPNPVVLNTLNNWLKQYADQEVVIVPPSALAIGGAPVTPPAL